MDTSSLEEQTVRLIAFIKTYVCSSLVGDRYQRILKIEFFRKAYFDDERERELEKGGGSNRGGSLGSRKLVLDSPQIEPFGGTLA